MIQFCTAGGTANRVLSGQIVIGQALKTQPYLEAGGRGGREHQLALCTTHTSTRYTTRLIPQFVQGVGIGGVCLVGQLDAIGIADVGINFRSIKPVSPQKVLVAQCHIVLGDLSLLHARNKTKIELLTQLSE